jgi:hypothetical protein
MLSLVSAYFSREQFICVATCWLMLAFGHLENYSPATYVGLRLLCDA